LIVTGSDAISDEQYRPAQFRNLQIAQPSTIDSLGAFLPGMQVLAGDLESAIKGHLVYWNLWTKYSAIPESWSWEEKKVFWSGWPGRPEYIEATYYLYKVSRKVSDTDDGLTAGDEGSILPKSR
jgi:mannosidase alpha-like ER degradation enhancer 1